MSGFKRYGPESILGMSFRDFVEFRARRSKCFLGQTLIRQLGARVWETGFEARQILKADEMKAAFSQESLDAALAALTELELGYYPIKMYQFGHLKDHSALSAYRCQMIGAQ